MSPLRWLVCACVCLYSVALVAQGAPQVFVSTGSAGKIYSINTNTNTATLLVSTQGADYEGLVVAPDNAPATTHPYLVYACDSSNNRIVRFDPAASTPISPEVVYSGGNLANPQCGRITATGDLVVTSKNAGSGWWSFPAITFVELGSVNFPAPVQLDAASGGAQGVAQKNQGDLLVVDNGNNLVLRSAGPGFGSNTNFITSSLSQPVGIARRSDGVVFVSNQGSGNKNVVEFDATGQNPITCQAFTGNDVPYFMQMSLDDTLYLAISGNGGGSVRAINAHTCQQTNIFGVPFPAVGVALPPTTATQNVVASNGSVLLNFGFTAFEMNGIVGPCSGTVSAGLLSDEQIANLITLTGTPPGELDPAVNLGLDGFEIVFSTANVTGCLASDGVTQNFQVADLVSPSVTAPEIVVCDDANTNCQPSAVNLSQRGVWPLVGYLPQDLVIGGSKSLRCNIFLVNSHPVAGVAGEEQGTFCGFNPPVNNTFNPITDSQNLALASPFRFGRTVPVKFKLELGNNKNDCHGPFITDAVALLSVAQIADSSGNPLLVPIGVLGNGNSSSSAPLFTVNGNTYQFNWDTSQCVLPSGVTQVCPMGVYSVTVVFLTNNTANSTTVPPQSIYTSQTTEVILRK